MDTPHSSLAWPHAVPKSGFQEDDGVFPGLHVPGAIPSDAKSSWHKNPQPETASSVKPGAMTINSLDAGSPTDVPSSVIYL